MRLWLKRSKGGVINCWRCELVMLFDEFEVDRVIPGCRGGTYADDNIEPICSPCNIEFGNLARDGILA